MKRVSMFNANKLFPLTDDFVSAVHQSKNNIASSVSTIVPVYLSIQAINNLNSYDVRCPLTTYSPKARGRKIILDHISTLVSVVVPVVGSQSLSLLTMPAL